MRNCLLPRISACSSNTQKKQIGCQLQTIPTLTISVDQSKHYIGLETNGLASCLSLIVSASMIMIMNASRTFINNWIFYFHKFIARFRLKMIHDWSTGNDFATVSTLFSRLKIRVNKLIDESTRALTHGWMKIPQVEWNKIKCRAKIKQRKFTPRLRDVSVINFFLPMLPFVWTSSPISKFW